jgi:hypothetical protein
MQIGRNLTVVLSLSLCVLFSLSLFIFLLSLSLFIYAFLVAKSNLQNSPATTIESMTVAADFNWIKNR